MDKRLLNRNLIVNIAVAVIILLVIRFIYGRQIGAVNSLEAQRAEETIKNEITSRISKQEVKLNTYKNLMFDQGANFLLNIISKIAQESGVKITSIRPNPIVNSEAYSRISASVNLQALDYKTLGKFINNIEKDKNLLKIDNMSINNHVGSAQQSSVFSLDVSLIISVLTFDENKDSKQQ